MSLYLAFFAFLFVGASAVEIPSYIQVCGRLNPKLDECIKNSVMHILPQLKKGIPQFDVPSAEPLKIDRIHLINMTNFQAIINDIEVFGMTNFTIKSLHFDTKSQQLDLVVTFPKLEIRAMYDVNANILVPVKGKGPIKIYANIESAKVTMKYSLVEKKGQKHMFFTTMTTKLNIADYSVIFDTSDNFNPTVVMAINQALGTSHEELRETVTPMVEKAVSETVLSLSNNIAKRFQYDDMLPNRE